MINVVTESINSVIAQQNKETEEDKENLESINAIINKEKEDIKKQFDDLKKQMESMKTQNMQPFQPWPQNHSFPMPPYPQYNPYNAFQQNRYRNNNNHNNNRRNNNRYNKNGRYCWTHGACDHWGRNCRNKANGHIDEATFNDYRGGCMNRVRT